MSVLNKWGTIAFTHDFMHQTIGFGDPVIDDDGVFRGFDVEANPTNLCVAVWLAFVPEVYRGRAEILARSVGKQVLHEKVTPEIKAVFIDQLLALINKKLIA